MFGVVFLLVMVDVIYLTVWQVMDPMRRIVREFSDEVRSIITICYSDFPCNRFIMDCYLGMLWRRGGLVVSALDLIIIIIIIIIITFIMRKFHKMFKCA